MQKINYIPKDKVLHWVNHCNMFCEMHPRNWPRYGNLQSKQELLDAIDKLPMTFDNMYDASRLAQCFQRFYTTKMPGGANASFQRLWALCFRERIRRYKWENPCGIASKASTSSPQS